MNGICTRIKNQGQVKSLELPAGWVELLPEKRTAKDFLREYRAAESEHVKLAFYYRGHRIGQGGADDFKNVLAQEDHELSPDEYLSVDLVVRNAAEADFFTLSHCRTETLAGKRVLIVEGVWNAGNQADFGIFIDSDLSGSAVQEIHFMAPEKEYMHYIEQVEQILKAIVWK